MIRAIVVDANDEVIAEDVHETQELADRWVEDLKRMGVAGAYAKFEPHSPPRSVPEPAELPTDADFEWHYRILGHSASAGIAHTEVIEGCENPPTAANLREIESTHERVMNQPGVRMATTVGPMRSRKKT